MALLHLFTNPSHHSRGHKLNIHFRIYIIILSYDTILKYTRILLLYYGFEHNIFWSFTYYYYYTYLHITLEHNHDNNNNIHNGAAYNNIVSLYFSTPRVIFYRGRLRRGRFSQNFA